MDNLDNICRRIAFNVLKIGDKVMVMNANAFDTGFIGTKTEIKDKYSRLDGGFIKFKGAAGGFYPTRVRKIQ